MIVGKSIFEGILLRPRFADFFLKQLVEKRNSIDDLKSLDPDLYKNLMEVKYYPGDVTDLGLSFSIDESAFGLTYQY